MQQTRTVTQSWRLTFKVSIINYLISLADGLNCFMHIMNINLNNILLSLFFISFRKLPKTETDRLDRQLRKLLLLICYLGYLFSRLLYSQVIYALLHSCNMSTYVSCLMFRTEHKTKNHIELHFILS